jgi:hypothetical protein
MLTNPQVFRALVAFSLCDNSRMWLLLLMALAEPVATSLPQSLAAPVGFLGEFSNIEFTEKHAYGYVVQLWRQGDRVFGFLEASEGLAGDTPIGGRGPV